MVTHIYSMSGPDPPPGLEPAVVGVGHCGEVWIELVSSARRPSLSVNERHPPMAPVRGRNPPGWTAWPFIPSRAGRRGNPIEIQLKGEDFDQLQGAADELKAELDGYPGTFDVTDDFKPGKAERQVRVRPGARSAGVTMGGLARQIRQAFYGEEALRIQRGRDEVKVMVRYDEADRTGGFPRHGGVADSNTPDGKPDPPRSEVADNGPRPEPIR